MKTALPAARGPEASRLRRRARLLLARFSVPENALPGSLALSYRRCGKPSCHCAEGERHPFWTLTFMAGGKKRVEAIPAGWVELIRPRVAAGRRLKQLAAEVLAINAQLLVLARNQRSRSSRRSSPPP